MIRLKFVGVFEIWWLVKVEILVVIFVDMMIGIFEFGSIDFDFF